MIYSSFQFAQYSGSPVAPEPLYSDIKLVSLFSKNVLVEPLMLCTDLIIIQSAGNETYLLLEVKDEVESFLKSS